MHRLALEDEPKLIICGGSAYPCQIDAEAFSEIANEVGALLLCDMSHFAGLCGRSSPESHTVLRLRHDDDP